MIRRAFRSAMMLTVASAVAAGCGAAEEPTGSGDGLAALSAAERDGVVFTREEEKLARDVYAALEAHDPSFTNIGRSEQTHMDAVATLLTRYDVPDPAAGAAVGAFTNPALQTLHDVLVARGAPTRLAALAVGVEIEELDLRDIEAAQQEVVHPDILTTYDNLTRGSRNHLRTFYGKLLAAGGSYTPKYLDAEAFLSIAESPMERGP